MQAAHLSGIIVKRTVRWDIFNTPSMFMTARTRLAGPVTVQAQSNELPSLADRRFTALPVSVRLLFGVDVTVWPGYMSAKFTGT